MRLSQKASKTAEYMALFRALETIESPRIRLFNDPYSKNFLSAPLRIAELLFRTPLVRQFIHGVMDNRWPGAFYSGVARTRLIDDVLRSSVQDGINQVVILGAGFDTRAYRLPELRTCAVFEVDHPSTLEVKKGVISRLPTMNTEHVRFVAIDFVEQSLEEILLKAGFDKSNSAMFIWEGVTNYLTADAVDQTLRFIANCASDTRLVFTYVDKAVLNEGSQFVGSKALAKTLNQIGEPWSFGLNPSGVNQFLQDRGFELVEDLGSVDYRSRYMRNRYTNSDVYLRGYEFYRIAQANVK
ncbi:SAM-dependent methyltransferase [Alicyclobacillus fastidiosus]|uniref:S-adenosyl-L-methionine-dependent methyltransferase n=1 Tax=Alicyclobacillus fastidiosus TaxID=392011 RepID=A0ABV5ABU9_9BACL|nr:SAM-dependent methyltransferase [Alicyclobacillus fastidiosus]WEH11973.1 SAM-dependent methyltransferase [Alicyclobacillus fastidiosus]